MVTETATVKNFLNNAQREEHENAKWWWYCAGAIQIAVLIINTLATVGNVFPTIFAIVATFLTLLSVFAQWRSDESRGVAQVLLRKLEWLNGFGWEVSDVELRTLHMKLPAHVKKKIEANPTMPLDYFSSDLEPSARRLIYSLCESSFFSHHLALRTATISAGISLVILTLAVVTLVASVQNASTQAIGSTVAQVATTVLVFLVTAGFVRLSYDYYRFSQDAKDTEIRASEMLKQLRVTQSDAIKLCSEYQVARSNSPLIPDQIYNRMRVELNAMWEQHQSS